MKGNDGAPKTRTWAHAVMQGKKVARQSEEAENIEMSSSAGSASGGRATPASTATLTPSEKTVGAMVKSQIEARASQDPKRPTIDLESIPQQQPAMHVMRMLQDMQKKQAEEMRDAVAAAAEAAAAAAAKQMEAMQKWVQQADKSISRRIADKRQRTEE